MKRSCVNCSGLLPSSALDKTSTREKRSASKNRDSLSRILRLFFLVGLVFALTFILSACQQEEDPIQIGVVNFLPAMDKVLDGFKESMTSYGYEEGSDIVYIYNGPEADTDDAVLIAKDLVEQDVDLILAFSTVSAIAVKTATEGTDIPVIFAPVTDPKGSGLVGPGSNMTGVTNGGNDRKRLEWMVDIVPNVQVIYIPYNPNASALSALAVVQETAVELGLTIIERQVDSEEDIAAAVKEIPEEVDVIFLLPDILTVAAVPTFYEATLTQGIPIVGVEAASVEEGALFSFGLDFEEVGHQAAGLADQLLRGNGTVNELPVEPTDFFLDINLATANIIGLEIPDKVLEQARTIYRE